jgi:acetyltransferase-like isoleucine patch superfamily enzyme
MISRRHLATSRKPLARVVRGIARSIGSVSVPAPRLLSRPALAGVIAVRSLYYFVARVFVCEPLFKAYCREYGRNLHTGVFLHWVQGRGDIILGDDVTLDGKISIVFAARYCDRPTLRVGSGSGINHNASFVVGRQIAIGACCRIASGVAVFDVSGHPADPEARRAGRPPTPDEVKPVAIGDNVWIGRNAIIHPGVTIGDDSVVSAGSVVMSDVPAMSLVAGNPARKIGSLDRTAGGSASEGSRKRTQ